jgi:hypothetical protein
VDRREFFSRVGLGSLAGYSLIVMAGDEPAAAATGRSVEEIRQELARIAPKGTARIAAPNEAHMALVKLDCDVFVAGGGLAGVCAAVAAARNGAKVVIVNDRSRLGGNSSSEVKMHVVGANHHKSRPGWREGGLIEEFRLDDAANNPQRCWELWDLLLYDKLVSEPNVTLLLDTVVFASDVRDGAIQRAWARSDKTEHLYEITAKIYMDCTGDSRLALESGAEIRFGREARSEFGESLAPEKPDEEMLGSSILFTSRKHDRPMPFTPPKWARKVTKDQLLKRPTNSWEYGYWWIEWGGQMHTIHDNERIRFELLSIVLGVWDYIKNSGNHPNSANWALDWVGMFTGKRESRRIVGDHLLTQFDLMGVNADFEDAVAIGGWPMDDHPPGGFDRSDLPPCVQVKTPIYNIPLRSLYSKNVSNLMMAGRNASASHVAFTSTRVMATCAVMGQAAGTAAAIASRYKLTPRQLYEDKSRLKELQQKLLRDDQSIQGRKNEDATDLARQATITASAEHEDAKAEHVTSGFVRDVAGEWTNRWSAPLDGGEAWLELAWNEPQKLSQVQLTLDSGFHRELTLTSSDGINKGIIRAPQPETIKDYKLLYRSSADGKWEPLAEVTGNHQRLVRHTFDPVQAQAVRLVVSATNGEPLARVFEVRCYA